MIHEHHGSRSTLSHRPAGDGDQFGRAPVGAVQATRGIVPRGSGDTP